MAPWMVLPRVVRLPLADGEWIDVKAQLNHGEHQSILERCTESAADGREPRRLPLRWAQSVVIAYLVDWSATDLPIRGEPAGVIDQALNMITQDRFLEMTTAIDAHVAAVDRERQEKKTIPAGSAAS